MLIPKVAFRFGVLDSTNDAAVVQITSGDLPVAGAVFLAEAQTAGRGQGRNRWHASPGANLTLSLVIYPDHLAVDRLYALTQFSALAVANTVAHFLPGPLAATVRVKWPNDIYVGDQKIAGLLVQNGLRGSAISWSVVGVGLNVNEGDFPQELTRSATSLALLGGKDLDKEKVLAFLLKEFSQHYPLLGRAHLAELDRRYHQLLYRLNLPGRYQLAETGQRFFAVLRGVNLAGQLRLELAEGREGVYSLREVKFL